MLAFSKQVEHISWSSTLYPVFFKLIDANKPKTPAQQKKSDERKAKDKAEIQAMLSDDFIYDVIEYTMSKEEAQMRLKQFLS